MGIHVTASGYQIRLQNNYVFATTNRLTNIMHNIMHAFLMNFYYQIKSINLGIHACIRCCRLLCVYMCIRIDLFVLTPKKIFLSSIASIYHISLSKFVHTFVRECFISYAKFHDSWNKNKQTSPSKWNMNQKKKKIKRKTTTKKSNSNSTQIKWTATH